MPEKPRQEIVVALAGPAVNVVIAIVLMLLLGARVDVDALQELDDLATSLIVQVASLNVFLVLFNLIPAFPMDGGRLLRALLALRYSRVKATNIAARIGQGLAFAFGFLGLMGNPMLLFIAIFAYIAATAEAQSTSTIDVSRQLGVSDAMITRLETLGPQSTVGDAVECLLRTTQKEFPVVDGAGRLRGVLTREQMIRALSQGGAARPVVDVMVRDLPAVRLGTRLEGALRYLQDGHAPLIAVVDAEGRLAGYISAENVDELMMVREAGSKDVGRGGPLLPQ